VALPAAQEPNDNQFDAWELNTGHFQPGYPQLMNDLQFFDQPIVANVAGAGSGPYIVEGSALEDLRAFDVFGNPAPGFPKFTAGWMVNGPSFGAFGDLSRQALVAGTREGYLFAWDTPTAFDAGSGPWPRSHHDLWNTGNLNATGVTAFQPPPRPPAGGSSPPPGSTAPGGGQTPAGGSGTSGPGARTANAGGAANASGAESLAGTGLPVAAAGVGLGLLVAGLAMWRRRRQD
jgi:hypothetical protein